jgi:hypothetical protein
MPHLLPEAVKRVSSTMTINHLVQRLYPAYRLPYIGVRVYMHHAPQARFLMEPFVSPGGC